MPTNKLHSRLDARKLDYCIDMPSYHADSGLIASLHSGEYYTSLRILFGIEKKSDPEVLNVQSIKLLVDLISHLVAEIKDTRTAAFIEKRSISFSRILSLSDYKCVVVNKDIFHATQVLLSSSEFQDLMENEYCAKQAVFVGFSYLPQSLTSSITQYFLFARCSLLHFAIIGFNVMRSVGQDFPPHLANSYQNMIHFLESTQKRLSNIAYIGLVTKYKVLIPTHESLNPIAYLGALSLEGTTTTFTKDTIMKRFDRLNPGAREVINGWFKNRQGSAHLTTFAQVPIISESPDIDDLPNPTQNVPADPVHLETQPNPNAQNPQAETDNEPKPGRGKGMERKRVRGGDATPTPIIED